MQRVIIVQTLMLVGYAVVSIWQLLLFRGVAPDLNWWTVAIVLAVFLGFGTVRLIQTMAHRSSNTARLDNNLLRDNLHILATNVPIVLTIWLFHPYGELSELMTYLVACMIAIASMTLSSIKRPPAQERLWLAPAILPTTIILYLLVYPNRWTWLVAPMVAAYLAASLFARSEIERILLDGWNARRQVEAERDAKTRFIASASHDLGQPLQAARLSFDRLVTLGPGAARDKTEQRVRWAFDSSEQAINSMIQHLQLDAGAVTVKSERVALSNLIAQIIELNELAAQKASVALHPVTTSLTVIGDPELISRALGNFVSNAIRHAKARRILIGARKSAGLVRLWVIDDGCGIATADQARLFQDYVQGDHGDEERGGFGLGLASAKRMADLMGGAAGLDPRWTKGSAFWLDLPRG